MFYLFHLYIFSFGHFSYFKCAFYRHHLFVPSVLGDSFKCSTWAQIMDECSCSFNFLQSHKYERLLDGDGAEERLSTYRNQVLDAALSENADVSDY